MSYQPGIFMPKLMVMGIEALIHEYTNQMEAIRWGQNELDIGCQCCQVTTSVSPSSCRIAQSMSKYDSSLPVRGGGEHILTMVCFAERANHDGLGILQFRCSRHFSFGEEYAFAAVGLSQATEHKTETHTKMAKLKERFMRRPACWTTNTYREGKATMWFTSTPSCDLWHSQWAESDVLNYSSWAEDISSECSRVGSAIFSGSSTSVSTTVSSCWALAVGGVFNSLTKTSSKENGRVGGAYLFRGTPSLLHTN